MRVFILLIPFAIFMVLIAGCSSNQGQRTDNGVFAIGATDTIFITRGGELVSTGVNRNGIDEPIREVGDREGSNQTPIGFNQEFLRGDPVEFSFVDTDIRAFSKVFFSEILETPYTIAPDTNGKITVRTSGPISRESAVSLANNALQNAGVSMLLINGIFVVRNSSGANGRGITTGPPQLISLNHITAEEALNAISSLIPADVQITPGHNGEYLIVSSAGSSLNSIQDLIRYFDVDRYKGMSFGLFPIKNASSIAVSEEIAEVLRATSSTSIEFIPLARLNAILVVSPRSSDLARVETWIRRLDRISGDDAQVYVYQARHRDAADLAPVISNIFGTGEPSGSQAGRSVSPGLNEAILVSGEQSVRSEGGSQRSNRQSGANAEGFGVSADPSTNSLIIRATAKEYELIETALRRLDVPPLQVHVEAMIAEVELNDALRYGVRAFFEDGEFSVSLTDSVVGSVSAVNLGFNFVLETTEAELVVTALEEVTKVEVISTPSLTVIDNQQARLLVGDQVPIITQSSTATGTVDAPIVNTIEYRDTGVILEVTPRVNAGGFISLDISQEVSDVVPTTSSGINSPTIRQREITSSVSINSGGAVVLGGLILNDVRRSSDGLPGFQRVPVVGALFGRKERSRRRTELIVIIRPRVIRSQADMNTILSDLAEQMKGLNQLGRY